MVWVYPDFYVWIVIIRLTSINTSEFWIKLEVSTLETVLFHSNLSVVLKVWTIKKCLVQWHFHTKSLQSSPTISVDNILNICTAFDLTEQFDLRDETYLTRKSNLKPSIHWFRLPLLLPVTGDTVYMTSFPYGCHRDWATEADFIKYTLTEGWRLWQYRRSLSLLYTKRYCWMSGDFYLWLWNDLQGDIWLVSFTRWQKQLMGCFTQPTRNADSKSKLCCFLNLC